MSPNDVLSELERLAARLGIDVRFDSFDKKTVERRGGLCTLRGRPVIVVDSALPVLDKIGVLTEALSIMNLEPLYVARPAVKPMPRPLARARAKTS